MTDGARMRLLSILRERAVLHGEFVLSSGQRSTYYLDARLVTLSGQASHLVGQVFLDAIRDRHPDAAAGLTLGADPIVAAIATVSGLNGEPVDALIVRKEEKRHGAGRRIEGPWRNGMRVAVVEDTMTTGASSLEAAHAVTAAGGQVVGVWGLIDRDQGAREAVESAGYEFGAIFSAAELLESSDTQ